MFFAPKANLLCYCITTPARITHICINRHSREPKGLNSLFLKADVNGNTL